MDFRPLAQPRMSLHNPLVGSTAVVPVDVQVDNKRVLWKRDPVDEWRWPLHGFREGGSAEGALWEFVGLGDGNPVSIERFARRYGVLAIRRDGLPHTARPEPHPPYQGEEAFYQERGPDGRWWQSEPVAAWRIYANGLRAVLAFGRELKENAYADPSRVAKQYGLRIDDFSHYGLPKVENGHYATPLYSRWSEFSAYALISYLLRADAAEVRRQVFGWFVSNNWVARSQFVPMLAWEGRSTPMTIGLGTVDTLSTVPSNSLYRVLVSQLLSVLTTDPIDKLDVCSVCGRMFIPTIRPGRHMRSFCDEHKIEGERARKRRWARKQAAMKRAESSR